MTIKSILDPRIYGLVMITGLFGVGKTTLATTAEDPRLTAILDFDLKFKGEAERLGFWYRSPDHVQDMFSFNYDEMVKWFRQAIADIPAGTTVVTIDNASPLEGLLGYIVSKKPEEYGVNPSNARSGAYGGVNPGVNKLWKNITLHLQKRGVRAIFVINHVGSPWVNGQPVPNKFKGKGSKALKELANLDLVLVKGKTTAPAAIVLKEQFAQRAFKDGEWTIQRVLPLRFPRATWKDILAYFDTPANFEKPKPGEVPDQKELDMYGELFTQQQVDFIKAVANGEYIEVGEAPEFTQTEQEQPKPDSRPVKVEPKQEQPKPANGNGYKQLNPEKLLAEVNSKTGDFYPTLGDLYKALGAWPNFKDSDSVEAALSIALDYANQMKPQPAGDGGY